MTAATDHDDRVPLHGGTFLLIATCFLLSGFAALLYETVWLRQFAIILGTSEQALAVILASYMGGLALGAWIAGRVVDRIQRPVLLYGVLEAGIALCAIAMPWGLRCMSSLQVQIFGGALEPPAAGSLSQVLFGLLAAFALILPPTAMMGATLPLLARHVVRRDQEVGPRIGLLYGINTFGAVAGTLAAAFLFLPSLGLMRTTWVGAAVNFGIFMLVYWVSRRSDSAVVEREVAMDREPDAGPETASERYWLVLWFAAAAGAVAFCYEIIFTRMLSHVLGGSIYAFATMLAGFLLGIALGGTLASRMAVRRDRSVIALVYAQSLAGVSALIAFHLINRVAGWSFEDWGGSSATFSQVTVSILILLPTATFIGATFPLATRILARDQSEAATGSARVYFFNTVGGIAGALLTGTLLLPSLGYQGAAGVAVLINAVLAIFLVLVMRSKFVHVTAGITAVMILACFAPTMPEQLMRASVLNPEPVEGDLIYSQVGRSGTVALFDQQGDIRFLTNGLPEAAVAQYGQRISPFAASGAWLSALPPLLRPDCDSMLIVGLGGGVAAAHVPPSVQQIDVFELEPAVVEANRFIGENRSHDPMRDDRIKLILNDGRNGLALTSKKYDAIVSQPSHPWTAGASHLYTREFAETVRGRLEPGGVFLQWMSTDFVNPELFQSLAATLLDVFPHARVYEPTPGNALFVASDTPIEPESVSDGVLRVDPRDRDFYADFGVQTPSQLFVLLRIDEPQLRELAQQSDLVTDEHNLLAMRGPQVLKEGDKDAMKTFLDRYSARQQGASRIKEICPSFNTIDVGMRFVDRGEKLDQSLARELVGSDTEMLLYDAVIARKDSQIDRWADLLRTMAEESPEDPRPAFLLLAHGTLGTYKGLKETEPAELKPRLNDRYGRTLAAIEAIVRNDLASVKESESTLASFTVDEVGYELAVRLRLLWRIADEGPERMRHGREALNLVAEATPVIGLNALVPFRVMAALKADDPEVALAATVMYAKSVVEQIKQPTPPSRSQQQIMRANLIRCHAMISDERLFRSIPTARYRSAIRYVDRVIRGDI